MTPLSPCDLADALAESPCLLHTLSGEPVAARASEDCFDFGDMRTCSKAVCVGGDETYRGRFIGHSLRLGFVIGIIKPVPGGGYAFTHGEAFKTRAEMLSRWVLE